MTREDRDDRPAISYPGARKVVVPAKDSPIEAVTRKLLGELKAGHTEHFKEVLAFYGRLHQYSFFNCQLIFAEKPNAQAIASYKRWQELGRQVRRGANGVWIFVPVFRKEKDENGVVHEKLVSFTRGRVFSDKDLTDIETNPLPEVWRPLPDDVQALYDDLKQRVVIATGYRVREVDYLYSGAKGECDHTNRRISILKNWDSRNKCTTLLHECIHGLFHGEKAKGISTLRKEFEAEACSFVLASLVGLESQHSVDYLLHWRGTAEELKQSIGTIHKMCREAIKALDLRIEEVADDSAAA